MFLVLWVFWDPLLSKCILALSDRYIFKFDSSRTDTSLGTNLISSTLLNLYLFLCLSNFVGQLTISDSSEKLFWIVFPSWKGRSQCAIHSLIKLVMFDSFGLHIDSKFWETCCEIFLINLIRIYKKKVNLIWGRSSKFLILAHCLLNVLDPTLKVEELLFTRLCLSGIRQYCIGTL